MFSKKKLRVEVQKVDGEFYAGVKTISFENLPIEAVINYVEGPVGFTARIRIYGASKENMNYVSRIKWKEVFIAEKAVRVYADDGDGEFLLFEGGILSANPVYDNAPNVYIDIQSIAGVWFNMLSEIPPSSIPKNTPVPLVFNKICDDFGIGFHNNGVSGVIPGSVVFNQTGLMNRLLAASQAYNVYFALYNNRVEIYPAKKFSIKKWEFTKGDYIGYPSFTTVGTKVSLDRLYNVSVEDIVKITGSEVTAANDTFYVTKVTYNVSTKIGGKWFMTLDLQRYVE